MGQYFEEQASKTLVRAKDVFEERGKQYADTWRECQFLALKATLEAVLRESFGKVVIEQGALRAIAAAVFVDFKYQRLSGGYKDDTVIDGINYAAVWAEEMRK